MFVPIPDQSLAAIIRSIMHFSGMGMGHTFDKKSLAYYSQKFHENTKKRVFGQSSSSSHQL